MKFAMKDPRDFQVMVLFSMLIYGLVWLKFDLNILWLGLILLTALISQIIATRLWKLPKFEWRSALISGLSLCILMRCPSLPLSLALAASAIFSKFIFRWNNKHIFNPTNFALALGILGTSQVTINPGQWANGPALAFFVLCMGIFVSNKACRVDVSFSFLLTYATLLFAYASYTGASYEMPLQKLQTASLLIFTFFMISDPRSTPNSRIGRMLFGVVTATAGIYMQLAHSFPPGLIVSLVCVSILTPLIDHLIPGEVFHWSHGANEKTSGAESVA